MSEPRCVEKRPFFFVRGVLYSALHFTLFPPTTPPPTHRTQYMTTMDTTQAPAGKQPASLPTIVIDIGSGDCKVGFGGEDAPRQTVPTLLGTPRHPGISGVMLGEDQDSYVGKAVVKNRGLLQTCNPIQGREVTDWNAMESLFYSIFFKELMASPDDHPLLLLDAPGTPRADRERIVEILFETFNVPAIVLANQACASLFASGRSTGVVVDSGHSASHVVPIWEGYSLGHYSEKVNFGGADVTSYLTRLLREKGLPFSSHEDMRIVEDMKHQLCYACMDYQAELKNTVVSRSFDRDYVLPDGSSVRLVDDRFKCTEALFQPSMMDIANTRGLHAVTTDCVLRCDPMTRSEFFSNILLSGGNTLFPGFAERLNKEVKALSSAKVQTVATPERRFSSWIGGYVLGEIKWARFF